MLLCIEPEDFPQPFHLVDPFSLCGLLPPSFVLCVAVVVFVVDVLELLLQVLNELQDLSLGVVGSRLQEHFIFLYRLQYLTFQKISFWIVF